MTSPTPGEPTPAGFVAPGDHPASGFSASPPAPPMPWAPADPRATHAPDAVWSAAPPFASTPTRGVAVAAAVTGIGAAALCWVPFLGILVALAGIAVAIVALSLRQSRFLAITGLALAAAAAAAGVVVSGLAAVEFAEGFRDEFVEGMGEEYPGGEYHPADFVRLDDEAWAALVEDPTARYGETALLFGIVDGYNEENGCSLFLTTGNEMAQDATEYDVWAFAYLEPGEGEWCDEMAYTSPGDHVRFEAVVRGTSTVENADGSGEEMLTLELIGVDEMPRLP